MSVPRHAEVRRSAKHTGVSRSLWLIYPNTAHSQPCGEGRKGRGVKGVVKRGEVSTGRGRTQQMRSSGCGAAPGRAETQVVAERFDERRAKNQRARSTMHGALDYTGGSGGAAIGWLQKLMSHSPDATFLVALWPRKCVKSRRCVFQSLRQPQSASLAYAGRCR